MRVVCNVCGKKVAYYRGVGVNRTPVRMCEHKKPDNTPCPNSRKPLHEAMAK